MEGSWHLTPCLPLEFPTVLLLFEYASTPSSLTRHLCTRPHKGISGFLRWGREMQAGTFALSPHVILSTMLGSIREASQVLAPNIDLFILWYYQLNRHRDCKFPGLGYTAIAIEDMVDSFRLCYNVFCTYYSLSIMDPENLVILPELLTLLLVSGFLAALIFFSLRNLKLE